MTRCWALAAALACSGACGKPRSDPASEGLAGSSPRSGDTTPVAAPTARDAGGPSPRPASTWSGRYKSGPRDLYIPPDWKSVHLTVKENGAGLGEGAISFRIDPQGGRVVGTLDGPLGPASIEGRASGDAFTATIRRKEPADRGFTGTLVGAISGERAEGTMSVSLADGDAIRAASFAASREGAAR